MLTTVSIFLTALTISSVAAKNNASMNIHDTDKKNETASSAVRHPDQVVLISFDGAADNELWERSRSMAKATNAKFTYFLSCVFYLQRSDRNQYQPPRMKAGRSNIGFAQSKSEISTRLDHVWQAHLEGHEMASHGCGHFDGKAWSDQDWNQEIKAFRSIMSNAYKANQIADEPSGWHELVTNKITGFRAPYLSDAKPVQTALKQNGFTYQASAVTDQPQPPQDLSGLWSFGLPMIKEGSKSRPVIAMDYNLYVRHSGGKEQPEMAETFEERSYQAFMQAFQQQYDGKRQPLQIGLHFVLMNDGAYWNALERFATEVCTRTDVRCITYQDYLSNPLSNSPAQSESLNITQ